MPQGSLGDPIKNADGWRIEICAKENCICAGRSPLGQALAAYSRSVWQNTALNTSSLSGEVQSHIVAAGDAYSVYHMQEKVLWTFHTVHDAA